MVKFNRRLRAISFLAGAGLLALFTGPRAGAQEPPAYQVDPAWPKELPNNWIIGQIGGIAVDRYDHIWVLQRPESNTKDDLGAAQTPPVAQCCFSAPPVLEFDEQGDLLKSWGGPGPGYDWPAIEHGILVDRAGDVWITGNGPMDRQALKFTADGKFILQIGHASVAAVNSSDPGMLGGPAGIDLDENARELYIADGYFNRRVIVFDSETGNFKRMWGAYGKAPNDTAAGPYTPSATPSQFFRNPVHCVHIALDGLVYVCDRKNDRIQVFSKDGKFAKEFFLQPATLGNGSAYDLALSNDKAQKYLLVADGENNVVWTLARSNGAVLGSAGHAGRSAGQFHHVHSIAADSNGNLFTGEVDTGRRVQKFVLVRKDSRK